MLDSCTVIGLFDSEGEARTALRRLSNQGISAYQMSLCDPKKIEAQAAPSIGFSIFSGLLLGALLGAGIRTALWTFPQLNAYFGGNFPLPLIASAVMGAAGGSFLGLAIGSLRKKPTLEPDGPAKAAWPSGVLLSTVCDSQRRPVVEKVYADLGARNFNTTQLVVTGQPEDAPIAPLIQDQPRPAPAPARAARPSAAVETDFLGRPIQRSEPENDQPTLAEDVSEPLREDRSVSPTRPERRGFDRRQHSRV